MAGQKEDVRLHASAPWEAGESRCPQSQSREVAPRGLASRSWSMRASDLRPGTSVLSCLPGILEGLPGPPLKTRTVLCLPHPHSDLPRSRLGPCLHPQTRGLHPPTRDHGLRLCHQTDGFPEFGAQFPPIPETPDGAVSLPFSPTMTRPEPTVV